MHSVLYYFQSLSLSSPTITLSSPLHSAMTIVRKTFCGIVDFAEFPAFLLHKSRAKLECPALMTRICTNPELTSFFNKYLSFVVSGSIGHESSPQASYINIPAVPKRPRNYPKNEDALNCPGQDLRVRALPTCAIVMTPCLLL